MSSLILKGLIGVPINPPTLSPRISPAPKSQNTTAPNAKSIKFFIMILPAFFALVNPVSTIAKPACMKNTRATPIKHQSPNAISLASAVALAIASNMFSILYIPPKIFYLVNDKGA